MRRELRFDGVAQADQDDFDIGMLAPEIKRGRDRDMGAVIAAHAVDCYGDVHRARIGRGYSPLPLATFLPR